MSRQRLTSVLALLMLTIAGATASVAADTDSRPFAPVQQGYTAKAPDMAPYAPDRLLVQFTEDGMERTTLDLSREKGATAPYAETGLASVDAVTRAAGIRSIERPYHQPANELRAVQLGVDRWFMLRFDTNRDMADLAEILRSDPNVEAVSLDWVAFPAAIPNDPLYPDHWGHNNTAQLPGYDWGGTWDHTGPPVGTVGFDANAEAAWDGSQGYGNSGIVIAILDSGVDIDHPDLNLVAGYDFGSGDSNPDDNSAQAGHGTACAGVAASVSNSIGSAGIAADCSIMPCKVANNQGTMYFTSIQDALYWSADNGADVISMSLGAAISSDPATNTALTYAYNAGCVILAATGNENYSTIHYPAIHQYVIGVGAASPCGERKRSSSNSTETNPGVYTDPNGYTCDGERWWGSNWGLNSQDSAGAVDILAPTILPTTDIGAGGGYQPGDYEPFFNGTSCSTPYAAGVCALIKAKNPTWSNAQIRDQLVTTAEDVTSVESGSGWDRYSGYGMVDAAAAVAGGGPVPPTAAFFGAPTSGDYPLIVSFTDQSTGGPTSWSWNFGDGGNSTQQNPTHTYTSAGSYTVTLTVSNTAGSDDEIKINYITVTVPSGSDYATLPYATGFETGTLDQYWTTATTNEGRIQVSTSNLPHGGSYQLLMDDTVNGGNYSQTEAWLHLDLSGHTQVDLDFWWQEFGDETHSQDGIYFSDNAGASFVKVQDLNGSATANQTWQNFVLDLDALCAVNGLGLTSTFIVKFQQYDNYMIATDGFGFDDISVTTGAAGSPPVAAFVGAPTSGDYPLAVTFTDQSTEAPTAWSWTFGDGGTSTAQNPGHTYTAAGIYTVSLTVSNAFGGDTETKTDYITVTTPSGGDYATLPYNTGFETGVLDQYWTTATTNEGRIRIATSNSPHGGSYQLLMDDSVNGGNYSQTEAWLHLDLNGQTQVDLDFWWQEFGDETHSQDGIYFSDDDGGSFVKVQDLNGGSTANQTWQNFVLDLDALCASNGLGLTATFIVKFQQYDNYMIATDGFGFDDISVTAGIAGSPPVAAFVGAPTSGVAPLLVNFTDQSTEAPTSWSWTFGDGGTSTAQNPGHTYTAAGTYTVSLTASNAYGGDTETKTDYITVTDPGGGSWVTITYDDFESGFGNYTDGGADCYLYTGGAYAHQGLNAGAIQDNSGVASSFYHTNGYDVSGYVDLEVEFWFRAQSMDNIREDFWVQYYDGATWHTVATYARGIDFDNGIFYNVVVSIPSAQYSYPANAKLRFMCDASGNQDDVYIDEIDFRGLTAPAPQGEDLLASTKVLLPSRFELEQNYPNPFNPTTTIKFSLPADAQVVITVFDLKGRRVATLADNPYEAGVHGVRWDAKDVASGTYIYRIQASEFVQTKSMTLLK